jgi:hypothetical protein
VANIGRSPSEPANFRPSKFSFLPQPDYRTAREPSEQGDARSIGDQNHLMGSNSLFNLLETTIEVDGVLYNN